MKIQESITCHVVTSKTKPEIDGILEEKGFSQTISIPPGRNFQKKFGDGRTESFSIYCRVNPGFFRPSQYFIFIEILFLRENTRYDRTYLQKELQMVVNELR